MSLPTAAFNTAKSIYAGLTVIKLKIAAALSGVTGATDTATTLSAHGRVAGDQVEYVSGTGFTGLTAGNLYFVQSAPTATTLKLTATLGGSAITIGTSSAGIFQPVEVIESKKLDSKLEQEKAELKRPDSRGVLRVVREVLTSETESFVFAIDEAKRLLSFFSGALAGSVTGTATLWIPDPQDDTGKVALKSEADFACTITRDGDMGFGDSKFTEPNISLKSNKQGAITWTADATA